MLSKHIVLVKRFLLVKHILTAATAFGKMINSMTANSIKTNSPILTESFVLKVRHGCGDGAFL